jgi:hypothetical protein
MGLDLVVALKAKKSMVAAVERKKERKKEISFP